MRRAPAEPRRSTSTSSGLLRSTARSAAVVSALLTGGLLAATATATRAERHPAISRVAAAVDPPGRWSPPFPVLAPVTADLIAPIVAVSAANALAVGSGLTNEDAPDQARATVLSAGAGNVFGSPVALAQTQQALAMAYLGNRLVLLTGTSPAREACCSTASTRSLGGGQAQTAEPLASGLEGATAGALVPVRGGLLAAVVNQAGITVARSDASADFAAAEQLAGSDPTPPLMAVGPLRDGGALVAWTAPAAAAQTVTGTTTSPGSSTVASGYDQPRNQLIEFATAGPSGAPGAARLAVTVHPGRQIDGLAVVPHGAGASLAWTESWYRGDTYVSRVFWTDVTGAGAGAVSAISPADSAAVGLSLAGSSDGREVLSWQACDIGAGTCQVEAALRPQGDGWGPVRGLGSVDPAAFPVAAQSSTGQSLVGWIDHGSVYGAAAPADATAFDPDRRISGVTDAGDLALAFGAGTRAAAVWVQGSFDQKLVGARFTP